MGQANRRGTFEQRKARAIELRNNVLGRIVETTNYGRGVVSDVRHDRIIVKFVRGKRTLTMTCPLASLSLANGFALNSERSEV